MACQESDQISNTSVCLSLDLDADQVKQMVALLADEAVAFDIGAYRTAPAGLRLWGGPTVDTQDMSALMPWLDWAFASARKAKIK